MTSRKTKQASDAHCHTRKYIEPLSCTSNEVAALRRIWRICYDSSLYDKLICSEVKCEIGYMIRRVCTYPFQPLVGHSGPLDGREKPVDVLPSSVTKSHETCTCVGYHFSSLNNSSLSMSLVVIRKLDRDVWGGLLSVQSLVDTDCGRYYTNTPLQRARSVPSPGAIRPLSASPPMCFVHNLRGRHQAAITRQ